jgi:hypothetical protein
MKSENKICLLLALLYSLPFLCFGLLLLFFSFPVHAAGTWTLSSNVDNHTLVVSHYYKDLFQQSTYSIPLDDSNYFYAVSFTGKKNINGWDQLALYAYRIDGSGSPIRYFFSDTRISILNHNEQKDGSFIDSEGGFVSSIEMWFVPDDYSSSSERGFSYVTSLPFFESVDAMKNYCLTGDTSGLINGGSVDNPDFEDTAYSFTGFTANNKMTATWTGTTERSYLQDQEVEEYVRVNYYFADKEAQDTIKQADAYPDEFATADKTLTIDVSDLKPDDENWFLRYIRITPCYRQAGLGAWGDFYHGEPSFVYFSQDGSIDRIDAPYIKGELSSDMERPVIVLHEAANGNPTESDYSYFEFNNAQSDYFFEMKGRWYTTNDFDLYRDKLVWKYKYSTLLKNNLSTWVSVSDNRSSVGRFQFDVLGKSSWDNLLSSYPVDDRNYIGGSYNLFNKITGYSDALETLKMLLKQPYSLFNGYEVYVRYFRYDENGGIQYSKWTHFYNNLADSDGSSGSRLDDLDNMYSENQSDKGLTDDELSDLENGGNSRNDLDAVPKNNYDYSSLENATMNFFDLLKNFGTMLGQFPSMVAAVFGFLPSWLIGLIAVAIGAVIVCRFIGR